MLYLVAWYILTWKSINNIEVNNIVSVKSPESSGVASKLETFNYYIKGQTTLGANVLLEKVES